MSTGYAAVSWGPGRIDRFWVGHRQRLPTAPRRNGRPGETMTTDRGIRRLTAPNVIVPEPLLMVKSQ